MSRISMLAVAGPARGRLLVILVVALVLGTGLAVHTGSGYATSASTIRKWQSRLNALGCDAGPVDGSVDKHTRAAVVRLQTRLNLEASGTFTATTKKKLMATTKRCDQRPVPVTSGKGRRIVISQRQNWVWLIDAKGHVAAQAGMVDNDWLDKGWYATGSYCGRPARGKQRTDYDGTHWLYNFVRFAPCGVAFHRVPVSMKTGKQIHADWYLGTDYQTSDGCIRTSKTMSQKIWDFTAKAKTRVRVV